MRGNPRQPYANAQGTKPQDVLANARRRAIKEQKRSKKMPTPGLLHLHPGLQPSKHLPARKG